MKRRKIPFQSPFVVLLASSTGLFRNAAQDAGA